MTAMERTEELVHNLLVAQNELILHLSILKGVPNLATTLFGSVEKKSTLEKNHTPEKNSSKMEKIRQTWMDDVVGLASEFYINEEAFNLENLSELLKATVGAITDILALGPEENSVNQTEKKITFREKLAEKHPELINDEYLGGCRDCPGDYWNVPYKIYTPLCRWEDSDNYEERHRKCRICWDRLYKEDAPRTDPVDQTES